MEVQVKQSFIYFVLLCIAVVTWVAPITARGAPQVPRNSGMRTGYACEGYMLNINCSNESPQHRLHIISVLYGRVNKILCVSPGQDTSDWSDSCRSAEAVRIVKERCQDKHKCVIGVSNWEMTKDPCQGTPKYLEVRYGCKDKKGKDKDDPTVSMTTDHMTQTSPSTTKEQQTTTELQQPTTTEQQESTTMAQIRSTTQQQQTTTEPQQPTTTEQQPTTTMALVESTTQQQTTTEPEQPTTTEPQQTTTMALVESTTQQQTTTEPEQPTTTEQQQTTTMALVESTTQQQIPTVEQRVTTTQQQHMSTTEQQQPTTTEEQRIITTQQQHITTTQTPLTTTQQKQKTTVKYQRPTSQSPETTTPDPNELGPTQQTKTTTEQTTVKRSKTTPKQTTLDVTTVGKPMPETSTEASEKLPPTSPITKTTQFMIRTTKSKPTKPKIRTTTSKPTMLKTTKIAPTTEKTKPTDSTSVASDTFPTSAPLKHTTADPVVMETSPVVTDGEPDGSNDNPSASTTTRSTSTTTDPPTRPVRPTRPTRPTRPSRTTAQTQPSRSTTQKQTGPITQQNFCAAIEHSGISWSRTKSGKTAKKPCPNNPGKKATWLCGDEVPAQWVESPDVSQCVSQWINIMEEQLEDDNVDAGQVADELADNTATGTLNSADITHTASLLNRLVAKSKKQNKNLPPSERKKKAKSVTKSLTKAGSHMLSKKQNKSWRAMNKTDKAKAATDIFVGMENVAFSMADEINSTEVVLEVNENILLEVNVVKVTDDTRPLQFPGSEALPGDSWRNMSDNIIFPAEGLQKYKKNGLAKVVIITYNEINKYLGAQTEEDEDGVNTTTIVNTRIITASINQRKDNVPLPKPLVFTLAHTDPGYDANAKCSYLDYTNSVYGDWSRKGCRATASNKTHTTCECDHLTNFAVLLDVTGTKISESHELSLIIITYVGCIISLVCLLLSWLTFQFFRNLQSDRNTIHKNLVFCLFVAELIFLFGINQADKEVLCSVIAGFLHYFFLAAFSWMCLEGIQLYVMLIEVFEAERSRVKYYYLAGYGVPALIVALSAGIGYGIGRLGYGTARHCWLETANGFIWSFVGPVAVVITINIVMLSIAIYMMCKHANTSSAIRAKDKSRSNNFNNRETSDHESGSRGEHKGRNVVKPCVANGSTNHSVESGDSTDATGKSGKSGKSSASSNKDDASPSMIMAWVKGAMVLVVLLGLTWAFGLLFISDETLVLAYIFTILNSFQGLFIFIFHCLMNEKVQKEYKKYVRRATWCPMCIRVRYGGHKGAYHISTSPTPSSTSGNYFQRLWSGRRRKKSASSRAQSAPPNKTQLKDINIGMARMSSGDSGCLSPVTGNSSQLSPLSGKPPEINLPMEYDEGIDLSIIDGSVIDSEFVSEYCKNNMTVENDLKEQKEKANKGLLNSHNQGDRLSVSSTDKGEFSSDYADTEIYRMNEKEKMLMDYELENQKNESMISTSEFGVSEISDDELMRMTERLKRLPKSTDKKPLIISDEEEEKEDEDVKTDDRVPYRFDRKQWKSRSEKTLSTVELLGSDDESEYNTIKRSMPNLRVISENVEDTCSPDKYEQLPRQQSLPKLNKDVLVDFSDQQGAITNHEKSKLKRLSSDGRTKYDPHRYRLDSSEC